MKHRLKKLTVQIVFTVCCLLTLSIAEGLLATSAYAQVISSNELINNAKQYNGKTVAYQGEIIGDIMARRDFAWINLHDGKAAVGVWIKKDLVRNIIFTGGYRAIGDEVKVEGVFNQRCETHGGDLDIHAHGIKIVQKGEGFIESLDLQKRNWTIALGSILFLVALMHNYKSKPPRVR
jgi:hypothetical protein